MKISNFNLLKCELLIPILIRSREQVINLLEALKLLCLTATNYLGWIHQEHLISGNFLIAWNDPGQDLLSVQTGITILVQLGIKSELK